MTLEFDGDSGWRSGYLSLDQFVNAAIRESTRAVAAREARPFARRHVRRLPAPVIYPGSVERTSFAERNEDKAYALVDLDLRQDGGPAVQVAFVPLPARPMVELNFEPHDPPPGATISEGRDSLLAQLKAELAALDPDSIVRIRLCGPPGTAEGGHAGAAREILTAACLRELAPPTMNVELPPPPL